MRLFIAEKPNLGKAIARGLGGGRTEQGCIRCGDNIVTWCFGHLLEPAYPEAYCPEYAQWRREHLPIIPSSWKYVVKRTSKAQLDTIGKLLRDAASVVHAGDPDREGQLLVDEVLEHFRYRGPVFRIWLPSLDDRSVSIALGNITDNAANAPLRDAARARMMADWLVGINATRALTITGRENGRTEVLSLGRVQTPTLALVVARDREIAHFKPSDYFVLRASIIHPHGECSVTFVPSDSQDGLDSSGRLVDLAQVAAVLESVNGKEGTVLESLREKKTRPAPLPHCLSSLQKSASARLGMSAKRVLDVAQSLYEKKLTTYPRTDCRYLPEEQHGEAASILSRLAGVSGLEQLAGKADSRLKSTVWNTKKITAHHAIIPTGEPAESLAGEERALFLLIATAYCLQFHPPMRYEAQKIAVALGDTRWEASGRRLLEAGWTALSRDDDDSDEQEQELLPLMEQGDAVRCRNAESVRKKTSPPSRFSEGSLIDAMAHVHLLVKDGQAKATLKESKGLGTEATRANIIETLKERGYLVAEKKSIVSTPLGQEIIDLTPPALKDPITTAAWEDQLEAIAQGKGSLDAFLSEQKRLLPTLLAPILERKASPAHVCPDCGAALQRRKRKKDDSWFWSCSAYPDCKTILPDDNGKPGSPRNLRFRNTPAKPAASLSSCAAAPKASSTAVPIIPAASRYIRSEKTGPPFLKAGKGGRNNEDCASPYPLSGTGFSLFCGFLSGYAGCRRLGHAAAQRTGIRHAQHHDSRP